MPRFRLDAPFTRTELVRRASHAALSITRAVQLLEVNHKKHQTDDLLLLMHEDWFPRILKASKRGMYACPLEFHLFTEGIETEPKAIELRKADTEERIRAFFVGTGFKLIKFERWRLERDRTSAWFYLSWSS